MTSRGCRRVLEVIIFEAEEPGTRPYIRQVKKSPANRAGLIVYQS